MNGEIMSYSRDSAFNLRWPAAGSNSELARSSERQAELFAKISVLQIAKNMWVVCYETYFEISQNSRQHSQPTITCLFIEIYLELLTTPCCSGKDRQRSLSSKTPRSAPFAVPVSKSQVKQHSSKESAFKISPTDSDYLARKQHQVSVQTRKIPGTKFSYRKSQRLKSEWINAPNPHVPPILKNSQH